MRRRLGLVLILLMVGACSGDSLEVDISLFGGDEDERSYDARYEGSGVITVSGAGDAVCTGSLEASLGVYDETGFGRLSLTYPGPGLRYFKYADRTAEERAAGAERRWVCQEDPEAFEEQTERYTTDSAVDGRYLFDLDVPLSSSDFHDGSLEVIVTSSGASLSGRASAGRLHYEIAVETMAPVG